MQADKGPVANHRRKDGALQGRFDPHLIDAAPPIRSRPEGDGVRGLKHSEDGKAPIKADGRRF